VIDAWKAQQERARDSKRLREDRVGHLRGRIDRLEEAFIFERSIEHAV